MGGTGSIEEPDRHTRDPAAATPVRSDRELVARFEFLGFDLDVSVGSRAVVELDPPISRLHHRRRVYERGRAA
jgi:hypothetical protein